jgi:uncharacterized protein YcbK (DUF882 family)
MRFVAVPKFICVVLVTLFVVGVAGAAEARNRTDALRKANAIMKRDSELWAVRQAEEQLRPRTARLMVAGPLSPLVATVASAVTDPSRLAPPVAIALYDENHRTHATWTLPVDGVLDPAAAEAAAKFFRCKRTDRTKMINRGTLALLTDVAAEFPGKTIEVVSAYRNYAGESMTSPHRAGRAIDFRVKGVSGAAVRDYMWRSYGEVGVGWYPHEGFVHVDHRPGDDDMSWTERNGVNHYHPGWATAARREGRDKPTS